MKLRKIIHFQLEAISPQLFELISRRTSPHSRKIRSRRMIYFLPKMCQILMFFLLIMGISISFGNDVDFVYNGFNGSNLTLNGAAEIAGNGLLRLTNTTSQNQMGHAFFQTPLPLRNYSRDGKRITTNVFFSTTFVLAIVPKDPGLIGNGMAFLVSPSKELKGAQPSQYLGLFNMSNNGDPANNITAVEFDTIMSSEFEDINGDHVGIDVNGLNSVVSVPTAYFSSTAAADDDIQGGFKNLSLKGGYPLQVWVEYEGRSRTLNVTVSSVVQVRKPKMTRRLLSTSTIDLSTVNHDSLYVGFSAATGTFLTSHYVLGWSFKTNGQARPLDILHLPKVPRPKKKLKFMIIYGVPSLVGAFLVLVLMVAAGAYFVRRRVMFTEVLLEDWERQIGAHRISYKNLYAATKGFKDSEVVGAGGFGKVYKGTLPVSKIQVAVKRVIRNNSEEGTRQFLAEITSIGRIRDRNFVELLGYCRRKGELLLVYEYMEHGSLDKFLYGQPDYTLNWAQRFRIIKQVAAGVLYLHERWTQTVLHRDIKSGNVLLDAHFNGRLGDFGLSRLYDHGSDPQATRIVGTIGYMAPELNRTGRATKATDVFSFGILMLEVVSGRRPIDARVQTEKIVLVDWVVECFSGGRILDVVDKKLGHDFDAREKEEMERVLLLGLLCLNGKAGERPSMERVIESLEGVLPLPEVSLESLGPVLSPPQCLARNSPQLFMSAPPLESVSVLVSGR